MLVVPYHEEFFIPLIAAMAPDDHEEALASLPDGRNVEWLMQTTIANSSWCEAVFTDDMDLLCVYGITSPEGALGDLGCPWMVGTDELVQHPMVHRHLRTVPPRFLATHKWLINWVMEGHTRAVNWLGRLGFTIHEARPHGPQGRSFHPFTMGIPECVLQQYFPQ